MMLKKNCLSTHGGSGYAPGSYREGSAIICGSCGFKIEEPSPAAYHYVYYTLKDVFNNITNLSLWRAWWHNTPKQVVPQYPDFIRR